MHYARPQGKGSLVRNRRFQAATGRVPAASCPTHVPPATKGVHAFVVLRAASVGAIAVAAICAAPADAAAPKLYPAKSFSLAAQTAGAASCAVDFVRGASIARRTVTAPADGVVSVRLRGKGAGDWDLGLVDKVTKRTLNGSAGPVADELADTRVDRGQRIVRAGLPPERRARAPSA